MGINVRVRNAPKPVGIIVARAELEKDIRSCMRCRFFYGNSSQCLAKKCFMERAVPEGVADEKESMCFNCPYRRLEKRCFPCMRKILRRQRHDEKIWRKIRMEKHIEVIGIDHGWSNMKTATQIFTTGVKEITTEPAFYDDVVELDGRYYKVGGKRLEVRDTKVENDNFYLLTLAAAAKEMSRRNMRDADVLLAVGLPLTRFGAEKQGFIDYLSRKKEVVFRFEKEEYAARIARVSVFPQCYAAVAEQLKALPERVVVVDIGSWTIDIMPIQSGRPDEAECITSQQGLIRCMRAINEECSRQIGQELEENAIQQVMATGEAALPDKYMNIVRECLRDFAQKVYNTLKEHGYNLDVVPVVFVGGGASVMRLFGPQGGGNLRYVTDVRANARGYEHLGRVFLANHREKVG